MVTKYADQLILDIGGCVCGISSCPLKVVPQDSVYSRDTKVEQSTKVAMVCACWLYTFHSCATITMTTEINVLPITQDKYLCNRAELLSVVLDGFSCSFSQSHTLSLTTHPLYESITDSNGIVVVLSSCMEITHFIHLLEVSKRCLNKHSFTFPYIYAPSKEHTRKTVPTILLRTVSQPAVLSQILMKATTTFTWKLVINIRSEVVTVQVVLFVFGQ